MENKQIAFTNSETELNCNQNKIAMKNISALSNRIGWIFLGSIFLAICLPRLLQRIYDLSIWYYPLIHLILLLFCLMFGDVFLHIKPKDIVTSGGKVSKLPIIDSALLTALFLSIQTIIMVFVFYICGLDQLYTGPYLDDMISNAALAAFSGIVLGPVVEEIIFRGIFLNSTQKYGALFSVLTSSLIFGMAHIGGKFFTAFVMGLLAGSLFIKTGSILWPILFHGINNSGILYCMTQSQEVRPVHSLLLNIILCCLFLFLYGKRRHVVLNMVTVKRTFNDMLVQLKSDKHKYASYFNSIGIVMFLFIFGITTIFDLLNSAIRLLK